MLLIMKKFYLSNNDKSMLFDDSLHARNNYLMIIKKIHSTESKETNSTSKCYSLANFTWLLSWDGLITHTLITIRR